MKNSEASVPVNVIVLNEISAVPVSSMVNVWASDFMSTPSPLCVSICETLLYGKLV